MALAVNYKYSELVQFSESSNSEIVILPQSIDASKSICFVMSNNLGFTSTYGPSVGNLFVTARINSNGLSVEVERAYSFQQSIECRLIVTEFVDGITVYRGDVTLSGSGYNDVLLPETWNDSKTIPFVQGRGNPSWISDTREYSIYPYKSPDNSNYLRVYHFLESFNWVCHYQVAFISDSDHNVENTRENSYISNGYSDTTIPSVVPDKTMTTMSLYGDSASGSLNTGDFPIGYLETGTNFVYETGSNAYTYWYTNLYTVNVAPSSLVQRQQVNLSSKTSTYALTTSVEISKTIEKIIGQSENIVTADTYSEETGDFMVSVVLIDRGDGFADYYRLTRGVSDGIPTSKVSVEFITFEPEAENSIILLMHNLKMKKLNNQ